MYRSARGPQGFTDNGGNLSTDQTCTFDKDTSAEGVNAADLHLGPLVNNGGPMAGVPGDQATLQTIALGKGSLAIDRLAVNPQRQCIDANQQVITDPITGNPITTDERGVTRPQGAGCESGAYEVDSTVSVLPGSTLTVHQGYWALIQVEVVDANGRNISSRSLPMESVELDGPNRLVISFVHPLQFGRFSGTPGYQLEINTRNLSQGDWTLVVQISNKADSSRGMVMFTVK